MRARIIPTLILLAVIVSACVPAAPIPTVTPTLEPTLTPEPSPTPTPKPFRIVAYITDAVIPQIIPFDKLTHINYFSAVPNADGTLQPMPNSWKIKQIIDTAHAYGIQVLICLGGGGTPSANFETVAADPQLRATFIQGVLKLVEDYQFDGIDMDWEFPVVGKSDQAYATLMTELRAALPQNKLLTAAVAVYGQNGDALPDSVFDLVDYLNIMAYDGDDHGTLEQFDKGLAYWSGRGLTPDKIVMGVPFYSHPKDMSRSVGLNYAKLVDFNPAAAQADSFEVYGVTHIYNGIPTIKAKTEIAMARASGMMFWTLEADALLNDLSLIKAIYETAHGAK